MTLGSKVEVSNILKKSVLWLVVRTSLTVFMEDVHIWHNDCLWCVDDNKGFVLPERFSSQRSRWSTIFITCLIR